MNQPMVALNAPELFSQGKAYEDFLDRLREVQQVYIEHLRKHGVRGARQKASVAMKVTFSCNDEAAMNIAEDGQGAIDHAVEVTVSPPKIPPYVGVGVIGEEDGHDVIFVQRAGSKKDSPRQQVLCSDDGRDIDQETGEITSQPNAA